MRNVSRFNRHGTVPATAPVPPDGSADRLAPVLGEILAGVRDIRELLTGTRKEWLTVEEVAELTGRATYTVRRWIAAGRLKAVRVRGTGPRGRLLVARSELQGLISAGLGGDVPAALGG
jgi:excisionase family DNA binding protein